MTFPRRLILLAALGLGLVGTIACLAALVVLWSASARLRDATEAAFGKVDDSLVAIQERTQRTQDRVKASAISTESISSSLKEWTKREAGQQIAVQLNLAEKSDKLHIAMQQADSWLELSVSSAESVQQLLSMISATGTQIDAGFIDAIIEEIASLRSQLAEATGVVEKLQEWTAAIGEEETRDQRIEQAAQLARRVIATLSSLDSRIERFKTRLLETQKNLQTLKIRTSRWIQIVTFIVAALILWMAAGQVAPSYLAWRSLHSRQLITREDRSQHTNSAITD